MSKKIEETAITKTAPEQYSKSAYVDAAVTNKDKLILEVTLEEDKKYSQDQVNEITDAWKKKEVK